MHFRFTLTILILIIITILPSSLYAAPDKPFSDVPDDHPARDSLIYLVENNWIIGYPDGTFKGDNFLTRYELTAILGGRIYDRLIDELAKLNIDIRVEMWDQPKQFDDIPVDHWVCKLGFDQLADQGLLSFRYDDGLFHGDEIANTADIAYFFGTLWKRIAEAYDGQGIDIRLPDPVEIEYLGNSDAYAWEEARVLVEQGLMKYELTWLDDRDDILTRYNFSILMANFLQRVLEPE